MTLMLNFLNNLYKTRFMGVFGDVDCRFDVRIANFKIADKRWRLFYSTFEVFEQLTQNLLYGYFLGCWLRFWSQNWKIQILVSELKNSKWRIQNGGYISANSQFFCNCVETWHMGVFGVADYESGGRIAKFKMEDTKFHSNCKKFRICTNITAILNFSILTLDSQSVAQKTFFLRFDNRSQIHAFMPKIRQKS